MNNLSFNGIIKPYVTVLEKKRPVFAPIRRNFLYIQGMPGAYLESTDTEIRIQPVTIAVNDSEFSSLQKLKEDLADWLITEEPAPLIFNDEPDRTNYAVVDGTLDLEEIIKFGRGTITFICPDPYKYGEEKTINMPASTEDLNTLILSNHGTVNTYPKFNMTVKKPITYLDIISDDAYMRIGRPVTVEDTIVNEYESILVDEMTSLVGWTTGSGIDGGTPAGNFTTDGQSFVVESFGSGADWHGPVLRRSISEALTNFQVEIVVTLTTKSIKDTGRVEMYLLDPNGESFAKLALKDISTGEELNQAEVRVGQLSTGDYLINGSPPNADWKDFQGVIRLSRVEGVWSAYAAEFKDGIHYGVMESAYKNEDVANLLAAVQVHAGIKGTHQPATLKIDKIKVFKRNVVTGPNIPYIAQTGDEITINHQTNEIRINGEDMKKHKDFGATYFPIDKGDNVIVIAPGDAVDVETRWRDRYK